MSTADVARLVGKGAELLSKVPASVLLDVVAVIKAIVEGRPDTAERLAKNSALAVGAKRLARERIKRTSGK